MASEQGKPSDAGVVSRLAGRGEDAITRLMDELGRNSRVTDAVARAVSAKGRVDEGTRKALSQVGLAPADEVKALRARLETLEERLSRLERAETAGAATPSAPKTPGTRRGSASSGSARPRSSGSSS